MLTRYKDDLVELKR